MRKQAACMARNMSVETKQIWGRTQRILGKLMSRIAQILQEVWVSGNQNYAKGNLGCLGGRIGCWISEMRNPVRQLATGIVQCTIPTEKDYWPKDKFAQFLGPRGHYPPEMHKTVLEARVGKECTFQGRKVSLPSPYCVMQPW